MLTRTLTLPTNSLSSLFMQLSSGVVSLSQSISICSACQSSPMLIISSALPPLTCSWTSIPYCKLVSSSVIGSPQALPIFPSHLLVSNSWLIGSFLLPSLLTLSQLQTCKLMSKIVARRLDSVIRPMGSFQIHSPQAQFQIIARKLFSFIYNPIGFRSFHI